MPSIEERLHQAMREGPLPRCHPWMSAGYTYLGQMVAHDLVPSTRRRKLMHPVAPALNLDSIYGVEGENGAFFGADGRFRTCPGGAGQPEDIRRTDQGHALIPDPRNDENSLISQLHLFWQRFHNHLIGENYASNRAEARELTTLVFQFVVVEDFLRQLLPDSVFRAYFRQHGVAGVTPGGPALWSGQATCSLSTEFGQAVFRFGHSLVRPQYHGFKEGGRKCLGQLFREGQRLEAAFEVSWQRFFAAPDDSASQIQRARALDPFVIRAMERVPQFDGDSVNVIESNLRAGNAAQLLHGLATARKILGPNNGLATAGSLGRGDPAVDVDDLPLWPYVLVEAEVNPDSTGQVGDDARAKLGPLGGRICAQAIQLAIAQAATSICNLTGTGQYDHRQVGETLKRRVPSLKDAITPTDRGRYAKRVVFMRPIVDSVVSEEDQ
jgi:hypothetical protein